MTTAVSSNPRKQILKFSVDNNIISELGERLVAKPSVALGELIKNAYDADATLVSVKFNNVSKSRGWIEIKDNGSGMSLDELSKTWMRIGTIVKKRKPRSRKYRRARTGSKGIGRFACQSLAKRLQVESVSKKGRGREKIRMTFDWSKFRIGIDIDKIPIECIVETVPPQTRTGTTLRLINLKKTWDKEELRDLRADIISLTTHPSWAGTIDPDISTDADPGFIIEFKIPDFPDYDGVIAEEITRGAWGVLRGSLNDQGYSEYIHEDRSGRQISRWKSSTRLKHLRKAEFVVHYVLYKSTFFKRGTLETAREYGREQGGIRVFLDGFRVFPYGTPGNDWIQLDYDRSRSLGEPTEKELKELVRKGELKHLIHPMLSLPGNRNLFGAIRLSRFSDTGIELAMDREGLVENAAYRELVKHVRMGVEWITLRYTAERTEAKRQELEEEKMEVGEYEDVVASIKEEIESDERLDESHKEITTEYLGSMSSAFEVERKSYISIVKMLRILSSIGTSVAVFSHELSAFLSSLDEVIYDLRIFKRVLPVTSKSEYEEVVADLEGWTKNVVQLGSLLGLLGGKKSREQRKQIAMQKAVKKLEKAFKPYMKLKRIDFDNALPEDLRSPRMYEAEFQCVMLNLLTNSIKATLEVGDEMRRISVTASATSKMTTILFLDSGDGLDKKDWDRVFRPFVSLRDPDDRLGFGTGLGLTIVRDIIEDYRGSVGFVDPPKEWVTCVKIELPN